MKKILCTFLCCVIVLGCSACGSTRMEGISDKAYEYGLAALETADDFVAGKIDADTAQENLRRVSILVDGCDGENDPLVASGIWSIEFAIYQKGNGTGTMAAVEEKIDNLAELLGE